MILIRSYRIIFKEPVDKIDTSIEINEKNVQHVLILRHNTIETASPKYTNYKYAKGYFLAVKCLYYELISDKYIFAEKDQLCYPFLFNCRHAIEITIKGMLEDRKIAIEFDHNLVSNWSKLEADILTNLRGSNIKKALRNTGSFVKAFNDFDSNSFKNRYPKTKNGNYVYKGNVVIDIKTICNNMTMFEKQMDIFEDELLKNEMKKMRLEYNI